MSRCRRSWDGCKPAERPSPPGISGNIVLLIGTSWNGVVVISVKETG